MSSRALVRKTKKNAKVTELPRKVVFLLPKDIFSLFVDFLKTQTIITLRIICKYYRQLIDNESFWAGKANQYYQVSAERFAKMKEQIKVPLYRFTAFRQADHPDQQKFIGRYAAKDQVIAMIEKNPKATKAAIYGIFAANRVKEFTQEVDYNKDEYWEPALDGSVAGAQILLIDSLLMAPIAGTIALTPLYTALAVDRQILAKLLPFYMNRELPREKLQELYILALVQGKFAHCNVLLPHIDPFALESLELKSFQEDQFSYLCGRCSKSEHFRRFLIILIRRDCREQRWLDFLFDNLDEEMQVASPFINMAYDEDNPNFFKFVLRANLVTLSEIPIRNFSWKHLPQTMMFLARNRHRDLPAKLLSTAALMPDKIVISFMVPYILKRDKKTIDQKKLQTFIEKHELSRPYLEHHLTTN